MLALDNASRSLMTSVDQGVLQVYQQQLDLEKEAKFLQQHTTKFTKQTQKWLELYKDFDEVLKVFGKKKKNRSSDLHHMTLLLCC